MKVRIGREELLTGLQRVQGVVEKRNTMPILSKFFWRPSTRALRSSRPTWRLGCGASIKRRS